MFVFFLSVSYFSTAKLHKKLELANILSKKIAKNLLFVIYIKKNEYFTNIYAFFIAIVIPSVVTFSSDNR